jgi:hypothetical protein
MTANSAVITNMLINLLVQPIAAPENQDVYSHLRPGHESHPCHANRIQNTPLHQSNGGLVKKLHVVLKYVC